MRCAPFIHSFIVDEWESTKSARGRALGHLFQTTLRAAPVPRIWGPGIEENASFRIAPLKRIRVQD